jgi:hypothetical protein
MMSISEATGVTAIAGRRMTETQQKSGAPGAAFC